MNDAKIGIYSDLSKELGRFDIKGVKNYGGNSNSP